MVFRVNQECPSKGLNKGSLSEGKYVCTFCIYLVYLCSIIFCRFWCIFHILEFFGIFWTIFEIKYFFSKISHILSFQRTSRIRNLVYLWKAMFKWVKYFEVKHAENDWIFNCIFSDFWEHICIHISSVFSAYTSPLCLLVSRIYFRKKKILNVKSRFDATWIFSEIFFHCF